MVLARIEQLGVEQREEGRSPASLPELLQDLKLNRSLQIPDPDWVRDVTTVAKGFQAERDPLAAGPVLLMPRFSGDAIAGAEEDDIQSGCHLFALHTTVYPAVSASQLLRLVTRALLDREDHAGVQRVGLYLTRQAKMLEWSLRDLIDRLSGSTAPSIPELREELAGVYQDPVSSEARLSRLFRRRLPRPKRASEAA